MISGFNLIPTILGFLGLEDWFVFRQSVKLLDSVKPDWWQKVNYFRIQQWPKDGGGLLEMVFGSMCKAKQVIGDHWLYFNTSFDTSMHFDRWMKVIRERKGWIDDGNEFLLKPTEDSAYGKRAVGIVAEAMDHWHPGWFEKVNTATLDMTSGRVCVLTQVTGEFVRPYNRITKDERYQQLSGMLIGVFTRYTDLWVAEIEKRKAVKRGM